MLTVCSNNWFKKAASFGKADELDGEKSGYSHLLGTSDDGQSSNNDDVTFQRAPKTQCRPLNRFFAFLAKAIPLLAAAWALVFLANWSISSLHPGKRAVSCSCGGTTVAEAVSRGCKFTPLAIAWLPPQCLDEELADDFDKAGPGGKWEYWADLNATTPITREEVGMLADTGGVFYTTQEWHVMHCMYTWRKHYRSKWTRVTIENRSNGIKHIHHCEGIVRDRAPLQKIWTMAGIELNADLA